MQVTYRLEPDDYLAYSRFAVGHDRAYRGPRARTRHLLSMSAVAALVMVGMLSWAAWRDATDNGEVGLSVGLAVILIAVWAARYTVAWFRYDRDIDRMLKARIGGGEFPLDRGDETLTLIEEGVEFSNISSHGCYRCGTGIEAIARTDDLILLYTVTGTAFVIPVRAFASATAAGEFVTRARTHLDASGGSPRMRELRSFLAERDAPCPECGYGLRGLTGDRCPECGTQVSRKDFVAWKDLGGPPRGS